MFKNSAPSVILPSSVKWLAFWQAATGWVPDWIKQLVRFGMVGVLNTFVDAGLYFLLSRSGWMSDLVVAKALSYSLGVLNSYYWNKAWTFRSHVESRRAFLPFVLANLLAVGLNTWGMHLALETLGLPETGALLLATAMTFLWNFIANKFFIFK